MLHGGDSVQIQNLASHLGHADAIHKNIYTQKSVNKPLLQVVKILKSAQGDNSSRTEADDECDDTPTQQSSIPSTSKVAPPSRKRIIQPPTSSDSDSCDTDENRLPRVVLNRLKTPNKKTPEKIPTVDSRRRRSGKYFFIFIL